MDPAKSPEASPRVLALMILRMLPSIGCTGHGWATGSTMRLYIEDHNGPCGYLSIHDGPGVTSEGLRRRLGPILEAARHCISRCTSRAAVLGT